MIEACDGAGSGTVHGGVPLKTLAQIQNLVLNLALYF